MSLKVHYHDGTVEEYPPAEMAADERDRFKSTGHSSSTRDGVLSIEYGMTTQSHGSYRHQVMIPLTSIRRIERS